MNKNLNYLRSKLNQFISTYRFVYLFMFSAIFCLFPILVSIPLTVGTDSYAPAIIINYPQVTNLQSITIEVKLNQEASLTLTDKEGITQVVEPVFTLQLNTGINKFRLDATAKTGKKSSSEFSIYLDQTSPQITIDPSLPSTTKESHISISANVTEDFQLTKVTFGDEEITEFENKTNYTFARDIELKPGSNEFSFKAVDAAGNEANEIITISRESGTIYAATQPSTLPATGNTWWTYPNEILPAIKNGDDLLVLVNKKYQLPSSYTPSGLVNASTSGIRIVSSSLIRSILISDLTELGNAAKTSGIDLAIISGYRSYATQAATYQNWVNSYGGDANAADQISARAGHSQHQLGTTIDFTTNECGDKIGSVFHNTKASKWLAENAWKYGFVIAYPSGAETITGYSYESWHYRYIGKSNASSWHTSAQVLDVWLAQYL